MYYSFHKYLDKITNSQVTVAVSTYAGKIVRGIARCNPEDHFDPIKGEALAMARCNLKVAEKRRKRAAAKVKEAQENYLAAELKLNKMNLYLQDSTTAETEAQNELDKLLQSWE